MLGKWIQKHILRWSNEAQSQIQKVDKIEMINSNDLWETKREKRKRKAESKIAEMEDFIERKTDIIVDQKTITKLTTE